jgi:hypothetical protein
MLKDLREIFWNGIINPIYGGLEKGYKLIKEKLGLVNF